MLADVSPQQRTPTCKQALHVGRESLATFQLVTNLTDRTIEFRSMVRCGHHAPSAVEQHFLEATQAAKRIAGEKKPKRKGKDDV